jgi:hypothetical protein
MSIQDLHAHPSERNDLLLRRFKSHQTRLLLLLLLLLLNTTTTCCTGSSCYPQKKKKSRFLADFTSRRGLLLQNFFTDLKLHNPDMNQ